MHSHTTELLPCPFCNGTPELRETGGWSGIGCNTNKCPAYLHALMFRTPAEAIAAWNRRSYATALCQQAERDAKRLDALMDAAHELLSRCEVSEDARYGTLSTSFVRGVISAALSTSEGKTE